MARLDRYDIIGLVLLALIAALWTAHFVLPTPPPLPTDLPDVPGLPGLPPSPSPFGR